MFDYRNNELCAKYQRGQVKDLNGINKLVAEHSADIIDDSAKKYFAIALKSTGETIGEIAVIPSENCFSLGYTISYKYQRQGYAFEAISELISRIHQIYPNYEFISFIEPDNIASKNLLLKLGYKYLGYSLKLTSDVYGKYLNDKRN